MLLDTHAVKLARPGVDKMFTWASGWTSPIYCDNRVTLSHHEVRTYICDEFVKLIEDTYGKPDVIVGVATGAIAHGVLVAQAMQLPFAYVRSAPKEHGLSNLIEGVVRKGQRVVVIEDLVSTGGSSLKAVSALREAGAEVLGMAAIFSYSFELASEQFRSNKCKLITLTDYNVLLQEATHSGLITTQDLELLGNWRLDPGNWTIQ